MAIIHHAAGSGIPECFIVLTEPDWANAPKVTYRLKSRQAEALTGIEDRSADQRAFRIRQEVTFSLTAQEADEFRGMLATLGALRIAVPLWCDAYSDTWLHAPQRVVSWNDAGRYAVLEAGATKPYAHAAPLLVGRLVGRPTMQVGAVYSVSVSIEEDSPWDCRIDPAPGRVPTQFEWFPDWSTPPEDISRDQLRITEIGGGREAGVAGADGRARWGQKAGFSITRTEASNFLRFLLDRAGSVRSFPIPAWCTPGADTPQTPHTLVAHFEKDVVELRFTTPDSIGFECTVWQEVPLAGGLSQSHESESHLYIFTAEGAVTMRLTSWEHALTWAGYEFTPQKIEHSNPRQTLSPVGDECEITTFAEWESNPLLPFAVSNAERRIRVQVLKASVNSAGAVTRADEVISGEIASVASRDDKIIGKIAGFGGVFRRKMPNFFVQRGCNYVFGDMNCKLAKADFAKTGPIGGALPSNVVSFTPSAAPAGDYADKWFAGGWLEVTGSDGKFERRAIMDCTQAGGIWTMTLNRSLPSTCSGRTATAYPGDDGNYSTCAAKFSNGDNFGGHPFTPAFIATSDGDSANAKVK